jgi:streptomycin 6-kinase
MHGYCSLVVPVRTATLTPAVLKISYDRDDESEHEHLALQHWGGRGAVRLLRADPRRRALVLERLHREDLRDLWDVEACTVVGGLYGQLHVPALPQLRTVASYVERWAAALRTLPRDAPVPRRLVEQTLSLVPDLLADQDDLRIVHGDLHYFNVLAADRQPWLAIDPKPMAGDPHYEPAPMLWNRFEELEGDVRDGVRRRFHTLVDTAGLDEDRARDWVVVRMVLNAHWAIEDARAQHRALSAQERGWITSCVAITKAVQD